MAALLLVTAACRVEVPVGDRVDASPALVDADIGFTVDADAEDASRLDARAAETTDGGPLDPDAGSVVVDAGPGAD